jgi:hypothetical protein
MDGTKSGSFPNSGFSVACFEPWASDYKNFCYCHQKLLHFFEVAYYGLYSQNQSLFPASPSFVSGQYGVNFFGDKTAGDLY